MKDTFVDWVMERSSRATFSEPKAKREATYKRYEETVVKRVELMQGEIKKIKDKLAE